MPVGRDRAPAGSARVCKTRSGGGKSACSARFGTVDITSSGTSGKAGYRSYSYLEPGDDYEVFDLADELGRVPEHPPALSADRRSGPPCCWPAAW